MKSPFMTIVSASAFAAVGLLAAFGIAWMAPTPPNQMPSFERMMFILLPLAGAALGCLIAYLAEPVNSSDQLLEDRHRNAA